MSESPGTLWVVATPIGNLDDLSPRAKSLLESVPMIAAEDTRVSSRLLAGRAERAEMVSLHEHNESRVVERLIEKLLGGSDIALVSDAGTPLISDPPMTRRRSEISNPRCRSPRSFSSTKAR